MNDNFNLEFDFIDILAIISFIIQLINYQENKEQSTNDDIFRELQKQNKIYLEKILENQKELLSILSELKDMSVK
jgi:deoxycytidylate deaminase